MNEKNLISTFASKGPLNLSGTTTLSSISSSSFVIFLFVYVVPWVNNLILSRERAGAINAASGTLWLIKPMEKSRNKSWKYYKLQNIKYN